MRRLLLFFFPVLVGVSTYSQAVLNVQHGAVVTVEEGAAVTVIRLSKFSVQLSWQTQIESKNKGFGIERRIDTDTAFTTAGFVDSKAVSGFNAISVSVMMWPNPNNGQFDVKIYGNTGDKEIVITNMQGKTVRRIIVNGNEQVHINGLAAGSYDVTIPDAMGPGLNFNQKVLVIK